MKILEVCKIARNVEEVAEEIVRAVPGLITIIQGIPNLHKTPRMRETIQQFNDLLRKIADRHNHFYFISAVLPEDKPLFSKGGRHLNNLGLSLVFRNTLASIKDILNGTYQTSSQPILSTTRWELTEQSKIRVLPSGELDETVRRWNPPRELVLIKDKFYYADQYGTNSLPVKRFDFSQYPKCEIEAVRTKPKKTLFLGDSLLTRIIEPGIDPYNRGVTDVDFSIFPGYRTTEQGLQGLLECNNIKTLQRNDIIVIALGTSEITANKQSFEDCSQHRCTLCKIPSIQARTETLNSEEDVLEALFLETLEETRI